MEFYEAFPDPGFLGAPIEINRGCIYDCVFCSEPLVKGNQVQHRDIPIIMRDIVLLFDHGIRKLYMITSELNPEGNDFILKLADSISEFNSKLDKDNKITWFGANYLLNFTVDELQRLYDSGFTGGWFDITALDDDNARAMRTPYRNHRIINDLKSYAQLKRKVDSSENMSDEIDQGVFWTMFMGNPAITFDTIRNTLKIANEEGISNLYDSCGLFTHIRVFDYEDPSIDTLEVTYSITEDLERKRYDQLLPSFAYPPSLLKEFSVQEITELFKYLGETFLSIKYTQTRDWQDFYERNADAQKLSNWLMGITHSADLHEHEQLLRNILGLEVIEGDLAGKLLEDSLNLENDQAKEVTNVLFSFCFEHFPEYFEYFDFPQTTEDLTNVTPYGIARRIYSRWGNESDLLDEIVSRAQRYSPEWRRDLVQFCAHAILFKFNIIIKEEYKQLLM
jgi:pyruvate-formate lyase-activating enzyme